MSAKVKTLPAKNDSKKPLKKASSKKSNGVKETPDDFDEPVWIDPNKQAAEAIESTNKKKPEKELAVEILKAKIVDHLFLYAEYKINTKDDKGTIKKDGENPIHKDLTDAFEKLNPYLAAMADQYDAKGTLDSQINCRGYAVNGKGVVLHGTRHISNGKAFNFNTPFYQWDTEQSESLFPTEEENDLKGAVNKCSAEVIQYLFKHKYQPEVVSE